jgi:hypothetical protein
MAADIAALAARTRGSPPAELTGLQNCLLCDGGNGTDSLALLRRQHLASRYAAPQEQRPVLAELVWSNGNG